MRSSGGPTPGQFLALSYGYAALRRIGGTVLNVMWTERQPFLVLVDDDVHSARLMSRMLLAHGAPSIEWVDQSEAGLSKIKIALSGTNMSNSGLVIVDLKSSSTATSDFVAKVSELDPRRDIPLVGMVPDGDRSCRDRLLGAGAHAVFERKADLHDYRAEAAAIVRFWVRNQHLEAVGT